MKKTAILLVSLFLLASMYAISKQFKTVKGQVVHNDNGLLKVLAVTNIKGITETRTFKVRITQVKIYNPNTTEIEVLEIFTHENEYYYGLDN